MPTQEDVDRLQTEIDALHQERRKADEERWKIVEHHLGTIVRTITGGDDPEKGLVFRVKSIETHVTQCGWKPALQSHLDDHKESRKWWLGLAGASIIAIGKSIWDWLVK